MDKDIRVMLENPATRKRPPKLKAIDRSISIAVDNYTPAPTMIIDDSLILEEPLPPPPTHITKPDIYFVRGGSSTSIPYDDCPHHLRKSTFRRSDTLDVHSPSNFQMRKTHSFHTNEPTVEEFLLSRRTSSVRGSYLFPPTGIKETERSPSPNRRSCRMHRSFNEQSKRPPSTIEGIKYPSLNDEMLHPDHDPAKLQPFTSPNISLDNEIIRSRSNSRTKMDEESSFFDVVNAAVVNNRKQSSYKHSSHSLDQQQAQQQPHPSTVHSAHSLSQQQYNFKRGTKHGHSLYLSPNSFDEIQIQRSLQGTKKSHSASMRIRPYRETLSATKKSKSFVIDTYPEFELSPHHRRDSRILTTTDDIKRSPRPSTAALLVEEPRQSFDRKASITYDMNEVDFENVLRPFRQSRRKSSVVAGGSIKKMKKKSISDETDEDEESDRKRKRIVCIIMTVFLCLVCASVFVVVVTLTHSSVAQVQNQTRKVYTFSRDSPIHYNVRQENERLMQESLNRAKLAKNMTEAASLSANEEIP